MIYTTEEFIKLKLFILRMLNNSDDLFDQAYTVARIRGENMNVWARVGHDVAQNKATIKYIMEEFEKTGKFM